MPSYKSLLLSILLASALAAPASTSSPPEDSACSKGVHMIVARGSNEPPGERPLKNVVKGVKDKIPGSSDEAVKYPASLNPYPPSEEHGVAAMHDLITKYAHRCPHTKIVLLGYSQGAMVIGDILGGGTYADTKPLDHNKFHNILAAVQIADPAHVAGKPYDQGTSKNNGRLARADTSALDSWKDVLVSYCTANDYWCDSGTDGNLHAHEVGIHKEAAIEFVHKIWQNHK